MHPRAHISQAGPFLLSVITSCDLYRGAPSKHGLSFLRKSSLDICLAIQKSAILAIKPAEAEAEMVWN
ncbi:hypothetical protein Sjap_003288 [Stephania japonica]|uniref:Uncharacterized protein n=1 Tax=Stephania japonica TaxID=461633 RepID=A0AAP0KQ20_9MAGN